MKKKIDRIQTILIVLLLFMVTFLGFWAKNRLEIQERRHEIAQIVIDEGFRACRYKDTLGNWTIGFGHLVKKSDTFGRCISPARAIDLLRTDYNHAESVVASKYPWADGEVYLILVNMTYQMGSKVDQFQKFLAAAKNDNYDLAASEMLDSRWARQAPKRAQRLAGRMMQVSGSPLL